MKDIPIKVEFSQKELKHLVAEIVAERVMNLLPMSSARDIAKEANRQALQATRDKLLEEIRANAEAA